MTAFVSRLFDYSDLSEDIVEPIEYGIVCSLIEGGRRMGGREGAKKGEKCFAKFRRNRS